MTDVITPAIPVPLGRATRSAAAAGRNGAVLVALTAVTNLGDGVCKVALPLLATRLTRSSALVAGVGLALALGVTAGAYVLGLLLITLLVGASGVSDTGAPTRPMTVDIREAVGFLWSQRLLRTMVLMIAVMAGCWSAWLAILPSYATE